MHQCIIFNTVWLCYTNRKAFFEMKKVVGILLLTSLTNRNRANFATTTNSATKTMKLSNQTLFSAVSAFMMAFNHVMAGPNRVAPDCSHFTATGATYDSGTETVTFTLKSTWPKNIANVMLVVDEDPLDCPKNYEMTTASSFEYTVDFSGGITEKTLDLYLHDGSFPGNGDSPLNEPPADCGSWPDPKGNRGYLTEVCPVTVTKPTRRQLRGKN